MPQTVTPQPLVSVVMCTYNGTKYLDEQVRSILDQDYENMELVIVDDCSTDGTWAKLNEWQRKFAEKIRIYQNEHNLGLNANFCKAIDLANGDFIAISDQDDIWLQDKISKTLPVFFADAKVVMAYTTSISVRDGKEVKGNPNERTNLFRGNDTRQIVMFPTVAGHDMVFRSIEGLKPLRIPDGIPIYDWWIAIKSTCVGNVVAIDSPCVKHRLHDSNAYYNASHEEGVTIDSTVKIFNVIASLPDLRSKDAAWVKVMADHFEAHGKRHKGKFDLRLFLHVLKNRNIIFYHVGRRSKLRTCVAVWKKCVEMAKW